jgi:hypothetical protein
MSSFYGLPFTTRVSLLLDPETPTPLDGITFVSEGDLKPEGWVVLVRSTDIVLRRLFSLWNLILASEQSVSALGLGDPLDEKICRTERCVLEGLIIRRVVEITGRRDLLAREHAYAVWQKSTMSPGVFLILFRETSTLNTA